MLLSWRKRQHGGQPKARRAARPAKPRKFRPLFETLETRVMLSIAGFTGTTINVTNPADIGGLPTQDSAKVFHGTLRQAINEANLNNDAHGYLIELRAGTTYSINSGGGTPEDTNAVGGDFDITSLDAVTIQGANGPSGGSIVDGNGQDRVFDVATGASNLITFDTLTIQNGNTNGDGGGMRTAPGTMVKLTNVIVQNNLAGGDGGGIAAGYAGFSPSGGSGGFVPLSNKGSLTIVNSQILSNMATGSGGGGITSGGHGGGIALANETANISNQSLINGNTAGLGGSNSGEGGGLYTGLASGGSNVTVDNSTISGNTAFGSSSGGGEGGGAWIGRGDTLTVQNHSTIGGPSGGQNTAAASTGFAGGGHGGGIYGDVGSTVNVNTSAVSYNLAAGSNHSGGGGQGGGISSEGIVKLDNSTVSHNTAGSFGGVVAGIKPFIGVASGGSGEGGGIFADGTSGGSFTSTNSHIDSNTAQGGTDNFGPGAEGGGVALVNENATILGGTVSNNTAEGNHSGSGGGGGKGGGIYTGDGVRGTVLNIGATADGKTVNPVTIAGNTAGGGSTSFSGGGAGGGIFLGSFDILKLSNSTVKGNQALGGSSFSGGGGAGGGIFATGVNNPSGGSVSIQYSTIDGNTAAAGNSGGGENPVGGGVFLYRERATILNSTISNNHADGGDGGGVFASGQRNAVVFTAVKPNTVEHPNPNILVTNSTIANNTAGFGGGLYNTNSSVIQLTNDTVAFNTVQSGGGGVYRAGGTVIVWNTIIAKNTFPSGGRETDVSGAFLSLGHNLIGLANGAGFSGGSNNGFSAAMHDLFSTNSNAPLDPGLNGLAANGGPTLTCSLKRTSPAVNAGDDNAIHFIAQAEGVSDANATDQRGSGFPRKLGSHIDIGAFEAKLSIRPGGDQ